jgi:hypothetical protein
MMKQFAGFQKMLQSTMYSLDTIGTWQATANTAFDDLRERARGTATTLGAVTKRVELAASRVNTIEARPAMMAMPPPIQPSPALGNLDLNVVPGLSSSSPSMDGERAKGHGEDCGGLLGPRP